MFLIWLLHSFENSFFLKDSKLHDTFVFVCPFLLINTLLSFVYVRNTIFLFFYKFSVYWWNVVYILRLLFIQIILFSYISNDSFRYSGIIYLSIFCHKNKRYYGIVLCCLTPRMCYLYIKERLDLRSTGSNSIIAQTKEVSGERNQTFTGVRTRQGCIDRSQKHNRHRIKGGEYPVVSIT